MARQRKSNQSSRCASVMRQPEMLAYYADRLGRGDTRDAEEKAQALIDWALANGKDKFLQQALDLVATEAGLEELWDLITFTVSMEYYEAAGEAAGREIGSICAELFAVPIILSLDAAQHSFVPLDVAELDWLTTSFREYGLKSPADECLSLTEHLWSLDEFNSMGFSQARYLADLLRDHLLEPGKHQEALSLPGMPFQKVAIPDHSNGLFLRFLVGIMIYPGDVELPFLREENKEQKAKWTEATSEWLSRVLNSNVLVLAPDNFYTAQAIAVTEFRIIDLLLQASAALHNAGLVPEAVQVVISAHSKDEEISELRIAVYAPDVPEKPLFGQVWELTQFDGAEEVAELIKDALNSRGIKDVMVLEDILPLENDLCTGGPRYARPAPKATVAPISSGSKHNLH
jgi:hypothetical protein